MPKLSGELSVHSLAALLKGLKDYKKKVDELEGRLPEELGNFAADSIERDIAGVENIDGNAPGRVWHDRESARSVVMLEGQQAAFYEFGTGIYAEPHPLASEANWQYGSGDKVITTSAGRRIWYYYDALSGMVRASSGMQPQMPVFRAAMKTRDQIVPAARRLLK